jgi:hypothetical protein
VAGKACHLSDLSSFFALLSLPWLFRAGLLIDGSVGFRFAEICVLCFRPGNQMEDLFCNMHDLMRNKASTEKQRNFRAFLKGILVTVSGFKELILNSPPFIVSSSMAPNTVYVEKIYAGLRLPRK